MCKCNCNPDCTCDGPGCTQDLTDNPEMIQGSTNLDPEVVPE